MPPVRHPAPAFRRERLLVVVVLLLGLVALPAAAQAPQLDSSETRATAGYYRLSWSWPGDGDVRFELQEATDSGFARPHTIYLGYDRATLLSGRPNGTYYYRIRRQTAAGAAGPWSPVLPVQVEHHSLKRAFVFFWIGAAVFLATLLLIVGGGWRNRRRRRRH